MYLVHQARKALLSFGVATSFFLGLLVIDEENEEAQGIEDEREKLEDVGEYLASAKKAVHHHVDVESGGAQEEHLHEPMKGEKAVILIEKT